MGVRWMDWSEAAFRRAQAEERPILLVIHAPWSVASRRMADDCFADGDVAGVIEREYVPVRVDADLRPDVDRRYNMGGLPTTAFLTAEGDLLGGSASYVPPAAMRSLARRMAWIFRSDADSVQRAVTERQKRELTLQATTATADDLSLAIADDVVEAARAAYDPQHGGFGRAPRRPPAALLHLLADEVFWRRDGPLGATLAESLGAMSFSPLWDDDAYGFFHSAAGADWSEPSGEKLLEDNALLLEAYVAAWRVLLDPSFRIVAEGIADYLQTHLAAPGGGFHSAEVADPSVPGTAALVDRIVYTDRSALAAHAYLAVSVHFGAEYRDFAVQTLERLWAEGWREGHGLVHYLGQPPSGPAAPPALLTDHTWVLLACCEAAQHTGDERWLERAATVARVLRERFWDEAAGAFRDTAADGDSAEATPAGGAPPRATPAGARPGGAPEDGDPAGPPMRVQRPLDENARAAEGLLTLAALTGDAQAARLAARTLAAGYDVYAHLGHLAAPYARAVGKHLRRPLEVDLQASAGTAEGEALLHAAYVRYHPWRTVRWRPANGQASAAVSWGDRRPPAARTPNELDAQIAALRPV